MRALLITLLCLWASLAWGDSIGGDGFSTSAGTVATGGGGGGGGASVTYTLPSGSVIHYISPTGNDGNNGLTPGAAWASPGHPMKCGDVIIVATGAYSGGWNLPGEWGTVDPASCPSTTGGIDGTGGVQFAVVLCAGNVGTCTQNGGSQEAIRIDKSHWSVQGFSATQNSNGNGGCFSAENDDTLQSHVAFINDIAANCNLAGYSSSGGGGAAPNSFNHLAAVGVVSFNAAQSNSIYCGSGISFVTGNATADTQTQVYISGYFGAYNTNAPFHCTAGGGSPVPTDGEGIIFDTYGGGSTTGGFTGGVVLRDAVIWRSGNNCVQWFPQGNGTTNDKAQYTTKNISCYANDQHAEASCNGEIHFHGIYPTGTGSYLFTNNLVLATVNKCGGTGNTIGGALALWASDETTLNATKINISGNYIWMSAPPTSSLAEEPNVSVINTGPTFPPPFGPNDPTGKTQWVFGTNTYANPGFTNPNALFSSAPNCTSYINVTDCMNDVAGLAVYSKIKPTVAPITMGYQPPAACAPDPLFPTWLKGVVYLHWDSATSKITMNSGLVSKPCNL